jgi:hypothetical protein
MFIKTGGIEALRLVLRVPLLLRWVLCFAFLLLIRLINQHRNR